MAKVAAKTWGWGEAGKSNNNKMVRKGRLATVTARRW